MPKKRPAPSVDPNVAEAERLKALGNSASSRGEYEEAHRLFSEAIQKNPDNAIYYANRAAVLLAQEKYVDAEHDCNKAVELDPAYSKAWQRLGVAAEALELWPKAIDAYAKALESLPRRLSPADRTFQQQCNSALTRARIQRRDAEKRASLMNGKMPWEIARILATKKEGKGPSCVSVLDGAYEDFEMGMISLAKQMRMGESGGMVSYGTDVIMRMSNAILTDDRVFHVEDKSFSTKMATQMQLENIAVRGWLSEESPAIVKERMLARLENESWGQVRPAITFTVRSWIWNAFSRSQAGDLHAALGIYEDVVEILNWVLSQFPDVPQRTRGAMFQRSFIRGVTNAYMDTLRNYLARDPDQSKYTIVDLVNLAEDIIEDAERELPMFNSTDRQNGHALAYWFYPMASAKATLAWCSKRKSDACAADDPEKESDLKAAAQFYKSAAELFPSDDFLHTDFMREHLDCLVALKAPLRDTLPICQYIRAAMPDVLEIWRNGSEGYRLMTALQEVTAFEEKYNEMLASGQCTVDEAGQLDPMEHANLVEEAAELDPGLSKTKGNRLDARRAKMKDLIKKI